MLWILNLVALFLSVFPLIDPIQSLGSCHYHSPKTYQIINGVEIDPLPHRFRVKRSRESSLRIHFEYMESFNSYSYSEKIKQRIMEPAKLELESVLRAKNPTNGILRVDRACIDNKYNLDQYGGKGCAIGCVENSKCVSTSVPDRFLKRCKTVTQFGQVYYYGQDGDGVIDVDIVLLVSVEYCTGDTYAHATSCYSEKDLDRPILGMVNICHGVLDADRNIRETINILKHEIVHTLGFAVDKYAFFRYPDGTPIVPRDAFGLPNLGVNTTEGYYLWNNKITKKVVRTRYSVHGAYTKTFDAVVLPNVVKVAREHFNCHSIDAVDLEDFGGFGSALTHFDEYFLYNELMTAETNKGIDSLSKFTLALLKDTGWYDVDFTAADDFFYGINSGCDLPHKGCFKYMENRRYYGRSLEPFCDRVFPQSNVARCSAKRKYYDYCYLTYFNSIMKEYQYFTKLENVKDEDVKYYMGRSEYNEFCPTKIVFSDPSSVCNDENNNGRKDRKNIIQSYFGPDSLCFENGFVSDDKRHLYGASCQRYHINEQKTKLIIYYGSQTVTCPSKNIYHLSFVDVENVTVKCPDNLHLFPLLNGSMRPHKWSLFSVIIMFTCKLIIFL